MLALGPAEQAVAIAARDCGLGPFDPKPDVAPMLRSSVAEVGLVDIGAADDGDLLVGDDDLLVVADQVAPAVGRVEYAIIASAPLQDVEERVRRGGPKRIDEQLDVDTPAGGGIERA